MLFRSNAFNEMQIFVKYFTRQQNISKSELKYSYRYVKLLPKGIPKTFFAFVESKRRVILYNHLTLPPKGKPHRLETKQTTSYSDYKTYYLLTINYLQRKIFPLFFCPRVVSDDNM